MSDAIEMALGPLDEAEQEIVYQIVEGAIEAAYNLVTSKRDEALAAKGIELNDATATTMPAAIDGEIRAFIAATVMESDDEPTGDEQPGDESADALLNRAIASAGYAPAIEALKRANNPSETHGGVHGMSICFLIDRALKISGLNARYRELVGE